MLFSRMIIIANLLSDYFSLRMNNLIFNNYFFSESSTRIDLVFEYELELERE